MSSQNSDKFFVGSIIVFLIVFGLENVLLSTMQSVAKSAVTPESMIAEDVAERIKPVAEVYVGEAPIVVAAAPTTSMSGEEIVAQVCAMCHSTGMMSSPKLGKASDWAPRIETGTEALYTNAINGLNMMPARGGRPDLSDDDVKAAVDHMLLLVK